MTAVPPLGAKWAGEEPTDVPRAFHTAIRTLVSRRVADLGGDWKSLVFDRQFDLLSAADLEQVEQDLLATGYRFQFSAEISIRENPDKYQRAGPATADLSGLGDTSDGKVVVALGDNVSRRPENVVGRVMFVATPERVFDLLTEGVPEGTIAVIDDSGGTLTAPILDQFNGVICLGGTVRSHLGILTREYGISCLMNATIGSLEEGDEVEIEATAPVMTAEAYESGSGVRARVWKRQ